MYEKTRKNGIADKEERTMDAAVNLDRPCTISESIIQSCKEVKSMREGRISKRSLNDLFANIEKWSKEEEK
ncbi:MAG: hypothetical protein NC429_16005 [Lachnospiraceae bacterium]|nr:hypothetical protein [Lachnospiraceae bacterium]